MDLERIRVDAQAFCEELAKEEYLNMAGLKEDMNSNAVFEKYAHLFSKELFQKTMVLLKGAPPPPDEGRRLEYLGRFMAEGYLESTVRTITDDIASNETKATVEVDGSEIPFRYSAIVLVNEGDRERRGCIWDAQRQVVEGLNPNREERVEILHTESRNLGYSDYNRMCGELKGIDLGRLQKTMEGFLDRTEGLYTRWIEKMVRSGIGIRLREARKHDVAYLFRAKAFDGYFLQDKVIPVLKDTLAGMGLDLARHPNVMLDTEKRERKSPRAFCVPLKVPEEIMLVTLPHGGQDDYQSILHEAGHALHFASVFPKTPFEYKYLGDNAVTESFAFLFHYLTTDGDWVSLYTDLKDSDEYLRCAYLIKLYMLRRYAVKFLYELRLHTNSPVAGNRGDYSELFTTVLKVEHDDTDYLADVDDGFYSADYLRAWIFEGQLRSWLRDRFGERWFTYKEVGEVLKELWACGQKYRVEELAEKMGFGGLEIEPLVEEIEYNLKG